MREILNAIYTCHAVVVGGCCLRHTTLATTVYYHERYLAFYLKLSSDLLMTRITQFFCSH